MSQKVEGGDTKADVLHDLDSILALTNRMLEVSTEVKSKLEGLRVRVAAGPDDVKITLLYEIRDVINILTELSETL